MNEFFKNRLDTAHALIDERNYGLAIEILKNLKVRIHDETPLAKLINHEDITEKNYLAARLNISRSGLDPVDAFDKNEENEKWKAQELLKFYDKTLREYDI